MKRSFSLVILILLIFTLFGCDNGTNVSLPDVSGVSSEENSLPESSLPAEESEEASDEASEEANEEVSEEESEEVSEEVSEEESVPEVSVPDEEVSTPPVVSKGEAVFLETGFVLYGGAAYTQSYFSSYNAPRYAAVYEQYASSFPDTRINVIIAPLASITILDTAVSSRMSSQSKLLDNMEAAITGDVNFVNLKNVYVRHAEEYLFFKSDHHWTHRGAYYAYSEFVKSVGLTPTPIEEFEVKILRENFIGTMYSFTGDERVKYYYDTVEAYMPKKACTMTIYDKNATNVVSKYDTCVVTSIKNYSAFIAGDHPYMVINVPENDQDKSILVIKDSYGNAFVPYLTEHYGNIIVIDPRHTDINVCEKLGEYGLDDIVFLVNSSMGNTGAWCDYFAKLIK
ncbi:MAG: hypothetical protein II377_00165 [Clostridia bacterium]|nr:hypothetical protein [Clostridia bacterium]